MAWVEESTVQADAAPSLQISVMGKVTYDGKGNLTRRAQSTHRRGTRFGMPGRPLSLGRQRADAMMIGAGNIDTRERLGRSSQVQLIVSPDVFEVLAELERPGAGTPSDRRTVTIEFDRLPPVKGQVSRMLRELAAVALALWPEWYGSIIPGTMLDSASVTPRYHLSTELGRLSDLRAGVSVAWLEAARALCRAGRIPLPDGFTSGMHASQLGLAIDPAKLTILLWLGDLSPDAVRLLGLSRVAEWLARETGAGVLVIVPESLARSTELDGISFEAIHWSDEQHVTGVSSPPEATYRVSPVQGRPHPYSPGEQLLARRLNEEPILGPLFAFNQRVRTRFEHDFLVDLLWPAGQVVVEVDGYEHHGNRYAFSLDRRRDYELTVSGYLVLRLPHDEVMADVELAIGKIRDMVRLRQEHPPREVRTS
jgi:very-short-patch-repair endonuclease